MYMPTAWQLPGEEDSHFYCDLFHPCTVLYVAAEEASSLTGLNLDEMRGANATLLDQRVCFNSVLQPAGAAMCCPLLMDLR